MNPFKNLKPSTRHFLAETGRVCLCFGSIVVIEKIVGGIVRKACGVSA